MGIKIKIKGMCTFGADSPLDPEYGVLSCGFHCCSMLVLLSEYVRVPHAPMLGYSLSMVHGSEALNLGPSLPALSHFKFAFFFYSPSLFHFTISACLSVFRFILSLLFALIHRMSRLARFLNLRLFSWYRQIFPVFMSVLFLFIV